MADLVMRVSRKLAGMALRKPATLKPGARMVSFTFDDAPVSACEEGAAILARHGARGTFYVAGGLTDRIEEGRPCHSAAHLKALHEAGHELACHGFSHQRYDRASPDALRAELDRNAAFLQQFGVDTRRMNFAYPFGAYSFGAKRVCGPRFRSSRVTGNGLHRGEVDLSMLGSYRLYGSTLADDQWQAALTDTARGGWLIVNTHEVADDFGPYGCSPATLDAMVGQAKALGCEVLTVQQAIDSLR